MMRAYSRITRRPAAFVVSGSGRMTVAAFGIGLGVVVVYGARRWMRRRD